MTLPKSAWCLQVSHSPAVPFRSFRLPLRAGPSPARHESVHRRALDRPSYSAPWSRHQLLAEVIPRMMMPDAPPMVISLLEKMPPKAQLSGCSLVNWPLLAVGQIRRLEKSFMPGAEGAESAREFLQPSFGRASVCSRLFFGRDVAASVSKDDDRWPETAKSWVVVCPHNSPEGARRQVEQDFVSLSFWCTGCQLGHCAPSSFVNGHCKLSFMP